jgi:hypothetical protein
LTEDLDNSISRRPSLDGGALVDETAEGVEGWSVGRTGGRAGLAICLAVLALMVGARSHAHPLDGVGTRASCLATNVNERLQMVVSVVNTSGETLSIVEPGDLKASNAGTASVLFQTFPRAIRNLLPGKTATFKWKGLLFGDGLLDLTTEMLATLPDGDTFTSGFVNCSRLAVGDPSGVLPPPPPPTPDATPTAGASGSTPAPASTERPTRSVRPTRTPIPTSTTRPTRTPIPAATPRPTRTPLGGRPTSTPLVPVAPTPTWTSPPTRTRIPTSTPRPTRTPIVPRPTRTPLGGSSPGGIDPEGLQARCTLRQTGDLVRVSLLVANRTGADVSSITADDLVLQPDDGAQFFDRTGPSPRSYGVVTVGSPVTFQWSGRLSAGGTMGFRTSARAVAAGGALVRTGPVDCGTASLEGGGFNPSDFTASCVIVPDARNGRVELSVQNAGRVDLSGVEPILREAVNSGSAQILDLRGPGPRQVRSLRAGQVAAFSWRARTVGAGDVSVRLEVMGTRPNGERISTGPVTCTASLSSPGGGLPDLTILESDLRGSILIETRDFARDSCALAEGCVAAPGLRRLLRFTTTTPNLGPGDLFIGDPSRSPLMSIDTCHGHFHFDGYAEARLLDSAGSEFGHGHKASFCLIDLWPVPGAGGRSTPQFGDCGFQGISAGWADVYHRDLDCQWVDITGVPAGRYFLELEVNPDRQILESNFSNNVARIEVVIPPQ